MDKTAVFELLQSTPYFKNLRLEKLQDIYEKSEIISLQCGETLLKDGDQSHDTFILLEGRLQAHKVTAGNKQVLGDISEGEVVGEMGALRNQERNATITAIRNSQLLKIEKADFIQLLFKQKGALPHLINTIVERTKKSFIPKHKVSIIAIVPISDQVDLHGFCFKLVEALNVYTAAHLRQSFASPDLASLCDGAVNTAACKTLITVFQADRNLTDWTGNCLSKADKIILLANPQESHHVRKAESKLYARLEGLNHADRELVLLHPSRQSEPVGTLDWISKRKLARHYHIAHDERKDYLRLARFLTGNAIGIALSGGGFRATAQLGILQALQDMDIPIDIIGGSSGGAFIGGGIASLDGKSDIPSFVNEGQKLLRNTKVLTFPIISIFSGKNYTRAFRETFKELNIEDLWIDFFCLSLSLVSGNLMIHKTGKLWKAIRASAAVMGIVPPVIEEGDCLVDGGFINPCPSNILLQLGAGKIIVINVSTKSGIQLDYPFTPNASGWGLLLRRLNPFFKQKISPNIFTSITQSMYMASDHLQDRIYSESKVDLFIEPPIDVFDSMDIKSADKLFKVSYEYGLSQMDEWKKALYPNLKNKEKKTDDATTLSANQQLA